ncbi:hypothetical protein R1sor_018918 [Riccia sorocarpa]|uniref:Uncharacterized protein n=1 Tax=Riccia sorocarpa TaxID=122646 RepID=A0ABD3IBM4_9MARC
MEDILGEGKWILAGDYNMVELHDDTKGKSAHISGAEARTWKHLAQNKGMVDAYLCAVKRSGGLFTRHAFYGLRHDRARLDRFYITEAAEWLHLVNEVTHHSEQVVSDHIPITMDCRLASGGEDNWRPKTYFKMGTALLQRDGVQDKVKQAWMSHPPDAGNAQRRWEMVWLRVREVLRTEKRRMHEEHRDTHDLRLEVNSLRQLIEEDDQQHLYTILREAETKLRCREQEEARTWRVRSMEKWLREEEAPTRYFYAQTKAKYARESIKTLQKQDGSYTTDRKQILQEVQTFYTDLYRREEVTQEILTAREEALAKLTKRVTTQQDQAVNKVQGLIQGLKVTNEHSLLHQLFADDTGVFLHMDEGTFHQTRTILAKFEVALGARLNLQKSTETYMHAIWSCPRLLDRTKWISWLTIEGSNRTVSNDGGEPLINIVDRALQAHSTNQALLILLLATLCANWGERNKAQFKQTIHFRGIQPILEETCQEIQALKKQKKQSKEKEEQIRTAEHNANYWRNETSRWLAGVAARNPIPPIPPTEEVNPENDIPHWQQGARTTQQMISADQDEIDAIANTQQQARNTTRPRTRERRTDVPTQFPMNQGQITTLRQLLGDLTG